MHKGITILVTAGLMGSSIAANAASPWIDLVTRRIAEHQTYPRSAEIRGDEGVTRLRIALEPDGAITQVSLVQSSGSPILDRQAQEVVMRMGRVPRPPSGVTTLLVPIVWRLN